ncbi:transcriptional regulator MntR [Desulfuribacillus alkaliarsenatis]|uniref:DNA-binding protein n=1 Tax=Desulfuribacillus alkaliarsenatis TaxID=766136 RepID=A0A1E5G5V9_9FIRM|nr:transcriptional regulator MntR [Desulfuribacillus alkaliarsenatis]OEF98154.1 DNA-binding protein [Desulfuribacillus alkaliarsenatis]
MPNSNEQFYTARGYEITAGENTLTPSMEDYIEMIYRIGLIKQQIRVNDLADSLNVQPPSVTKMVQKLSEKKLLHYERYGLIQLTEEGSNLGEFFLNRHNTVKEFLSMLGIKDNLQKDVEQMEHYVSWNTYTVINQFVGFLNENQQVLQQYQSYIINKSCKKAD